MLLGTEEVRRSDALLCTILVFRPPKSMNAKTLNPKPYTVSV